MPVKSSRVDINILSQALAEVTTRNKYGGFNVAKTIKTVTANDDTEFFSITGTGYIFSVGVVTYGSDIQHDDYLYGYFDGVRDDTPTYKQLLDWNLVYSLYGFPLIGTYDEVNYLYSLGWFGNVTIEEGFKNGYHESHGRTPTVVMFTLYAVI